MPDVGTEVQQLFQSQDVIDRNIGAGNGPGKGLIAFADNAAVGRIYRNQFASDVFDLRSQQVQDKVHCRIKELADVLQVETKSRAQFSVIKIAVGKGDIAQLDAFGADQKIERQVEREAVLEIDVVGQVVFVIKGETAVNQRNTAAEIELEFAVIVVNAAGIDKGSQGDEVLIGEGKVNIIDNYRGTEVEFFEIKRTVLPGQVDGEIKGQAGVDLKVDIQAPGDHQAAAGKIASKVCGDTLAHRPGNIYLDGELGTDIVHGKEAGRTSTGDIGQGDHPVILQKRDQSSPDLGNRQRTKGIGKVAPVNGIQISEEIGIDIKYGFQGVIGGRHAAQAVIENGHLVKNTVDSIIGAGDGHIEKIEAEELTFKITDKPGQLFQQGTDGAVGQVSGQIADIGSFDEHGRVSAGAVKAEHLQKYLFQAFVRIGIVDRVGVDPQRCRQVGDHPEDVYGQRHEQVEPAIHPGKHHVIAEQSFIKTVTAVVIHAGPRLLVEHKSHSHEIAAVIGIA